MKKIFIVLSAVAFSFSLTSCKKDYSCACTWEEAHGSHHHDESETFTLGKLDKQDAESACNKEKAAIATDVDNTNIECALKSN